MWTHCAHAWLETLFIYLLWNRLQWGLCFLACLRHAEIFHNLSWFMVWKCFFQWDSETANVLEGCHVISQCKWSHLLLPKLSVFFLFFFFLSKASVLCCVTGQSLQGQGGHWVLTSVFIRGLEVLSDQTSSSFFSKNYLSVSDKQLHQKTGLSSVNTELPDIFHQGDSAVNNTHPLEDAISVLKCDLIHEIVFQWAHFWPWNTFRWCISLHCWR